LRLSMVRKFIRMKISTPGENLMASGSLKWHTNSIGVIA